MHFFYIDESGDTGTNLNDPNQPIFVLGGISLRDEGWNKTRDTFLRLVRGFFGGTLLEGFELHASDLLSPGGGEFFSGFDLEDRVDLAREVFTLLEERKHGVHFIAFEKKKIEEVACGLTLAFNPSRPYLLGFDYLITYIHWLVKTRLGSSARGMVILDEKREHHDSIEKIINERRTSGPEAHRVKRIVEISYPVDSRRNPMIQISDLVIFCIRRFLEMDHGHHEDWCEDARDFHSTTYARLVARVDRVGTVPRGGRGLARLNEYLNEVRCDPKGRWRVRYGLN